MQKCNNDCYPNRRQFISSMLPLCAFTCLSIKNLHASNNNESESQDITFKERINEDYCKTYEQAWQFRYNYYIDSMEFFANEIGRDKVIEILKKENDSILINDSSDKSENTFSKYVEILKSKIDKSYRNLLQVKVVDETDKAIEIRVSNCLWAKTFLDKNAGDIGYATICYGDYPKATYYNPKLNLKFTKTLMQGNDCCNHRYHWKEE